MLLQKGVYPYQHTDDREKFNETSLREKEDFYSHLNMEGITDEHTKVINTQKEFVKILK